MHLPRSHDSNVQASISRGRELLKEVMRTEGNCMDFPAVNRGIEADRYDPYATLKGPPSKEQLYEMLEHAEVRSAYYANLARESQQLLADARDLTAALVVDYVLGESDGEGGFKGPPLVYRPDERGSAGFRAWSSALHPALTSGAARGGSGSGSGRGWGRRSRCSSWGSGWRGSLRGGAAGCGAAHRWLCLQHHGRRTTGIRFGSEGAGVWHAKPSGKWQIGVLPAQESVG